MSMYLFHKLYPLSDTIVIPLNNLFIKFHKNIINLNQLRKFI